MLVIVSVGVGQGRHLDELCAAEPQQVLLFLALGVRNHDQRPVTACVRHHRQSNAGIAGGRFHHQPAGLEVTALLGLQDHPLAGAVLHRLAGIHELGLAENGATGRLGSLLELHERRVADRFNDSVGNLHGSPDIGRA